MNVALTSIISALCTPFVGFMVNVFQDKIVFALARFTTGSNIRHPDGVYRTSIYNHYTFLKAYFFSQGHGLQSRYLNFYKTVVQWLFRFFFLQKFLLLLLFLIYFTTTFGVSLINL